MHLTTVVHAAIWTLLPLISAKTMQYGQFNTPDNVSQKVAWISGTDICTALVPVLTEGNQNACDVPFNFPERAPGYLFSFVNCNQDGVPQAMLVTPNGGPTNQVTGNGFSEPLGCSSGHQFTRGVLGNQFGLPF